MSYRANRLGFRADTEFTDSRKQPLVAALGDSFTFGFGVRDDETFVHWLDEQVRPDGCVANFAVPGTSTDQQALLLERRLVHFHPSVVILVVYLGNDLVDIRRPYPVQASNGKPFFELGPQGLTLRNVPVPRQSQPVAAAKQDLQRAILGEATMPSSPRMSYPSDLTQRFAAEEDVDRLHCLHKQVVNPHGQGNALSPAGSKRSATIDELRIPLRTHWVKDAPSGIGIRCAHRSRPRISALDKIDRLPERA